MSKKLSHFFVILWGLRKLKKGCLFFSFPHLNFVQNCLQEAEISTDLKIAINDEM